jgi:hypothetical protein
MVRRSLIPFNPGPNKTSSDVLWHAAQLFLNNDSPSAASCEKDALAVANNKAIEKRKVRRVDFLQNISYEFFFYFSAQNYYLKY